MPWAPKDPAAIERRRMSARATDRERKTSEAHRLYGTTAWRKLRKLHLSAEPLCRTCMAEGVVEAATVVDHIQPHRGDVALFFDRANLQSQCARHHNRKTATEDGGFGRATGVSINHERAGAHTAWGVERATCSPSIIFPGADE